MDEFGRRRGAEGAGRWERWGGREGSEWSYGLEPASSSTENAISRLPKGSGEWIRVV